MSQEALKCYKFFCFHRVKGLLGGGCTVLLRGSQTPCSPRGAPGPADQERPGLSPASQPPPAYLIVLSHQRKRARESTPCMRVWESRAPLIPVNVNQSQQKEQPYFERREWSQTDFQMTCWHWLSKWSGMPCAGERLVFTLQGEVSDLGRILALSIFHSQGEGSAQGNAISFVDACPCSVFQRRTYGFDLGMVLWFGDAIIVLWLWDP